MATPEIQLIVTDMDGTLLDGNHQLPKQFPAVMHHLSMRGIHWAIASGRQLANLRLRFAELNLFPDLIAENGALAQLGSGAKPFFQDLTPTAFFADILQEACTISKATPVLCGADCAWIEASYPEHLPEVHRYFSQTALWCDLAPLHALPICKIAVYHPNAAEALWPRLAPLAHADCRVILSSPCWIDVQPARINKGEALKALLTQRHLRPSQAIVFGDYLNDVEMMTLGTHAVAMDNAHPDLKQLCPYHTRANTENGVLWYLRKIGLLMKKWELSFGRIF